MVGENIESEVRFGESLDFEIFTKHTQIKTRLSKKFYPGSVEACFKTIIKKKNLLQTIASFGLLTILDHGQ